MAKVRAALIQAHANMPKEEAIKKHEELIDVGVDQFNLYLMVDKPEAVIKRYGEDIIPAFS